MALTYSTYITTMANLLTVPADDANFLQILPTMIDFGEQQNYRSLDLLGATVRDSSASFTANSRNFTLPVPATGRYVVVDAINVLNTGVRVAQLEPVSLEWLDAAYPSETATAASALPQYFAMVSDQTISVGPAPGSAFGAEVVGEIRPLPLSAINTETYLTLYLPDIFIAASMIFGSGDWQKNAEMAVAWSAQYESLKQSADLEEHRKRFASVSWTSKQPSPVAIPQRG